VLTARAIGTAGYRHRGIVRRAAVHVAAGGAPLKATVRSASRDALGVVKVVSDHDLT